MVMNLTPFVDITLLRRSLTVNIPAVGVPQSPEKLELVTFQKTGIKREFKFSTDVILTISLIVLVLAIWTLFSPLGIAN